MALSACDDEDGGGGGTVCDQAAAIIENDCGQMLESGESGGEAMACEGVNEASSQCVVDNPDAACDFYDDPLNPDNAFAMCVAEVGS